MFEYDFLKLISSHVKQYEEFPLPVAIADRELVVAWCNRACRAALPVVAERGGLSGFLLEHPAEEIFEALEQRGSYTATEVIPLSGLSASVLPVLAGEETVGAVVLFLSLEARPGIQAAYNVSKYTQGFSANIRDCVDDIFTTMDAAAIKADLLHSGWVKQSFSRIGAGGYRILRIAENISLYARLQSGVQELRMHSCDAAETLSAISEALCETGRSVGVEIELCLPDTPCFVTIDCFTMEAVLFNLLHNSIYFTRPGNRVRVALAHGEKAVSLTISDRGLGIPEHILPKIWRPYTVYTHGERGAGLGLGLAIVKQVCDLHGAQITLESVYGQGTTAVLTVPSARPGSPIGLRQNEVPYRLDDRFSSLYIGLADAAVSPFREPEE